MKNLISKYNDKTVLITGHTGFKGGWLAFWLKNLGAKVVGFSLSPPSVPNFFSALKLEYSLDHHYGDITDLTALQNVINQYNPEIVFHLAAQPIVRLSYEDPVGTYESNVMGTVKVLEAIRLNGKVKAVINVTSDKCYENREWYWGYRENEPMGGADPYSSSKGCAELVSSAYLRSFFNPNVYMDEHFTLCASVRAGNVIGGGDWGSQRIIPDLVRAFSSGNELVLRHPGAIRPWQHVLEPLSGYLLLGLRLIDGQAAFAKGWNFGPNDTSAWSVGNIVALAQKIWGGGSVRVDDGKHLHEAKWLKLDCSQARHELGWLPFWNVPKTIKKTLEWYKLYYSGANEKELIARTKAQIEEYEQDQYHINNL